MLISEECVVTYLSPLQVRRAPVLPASERVTMGVSQQLAASRSIQVTLPSYHPYP